MVSGSLILFFALIYFLLTRESALNIKKNDTLEFRLAVFGLNIRFGKNKKSENAKRTKRKERPDYLKLLSKITKRLSKSKITISKVTLPSKAEEFTPSAFLLPYGKYAAIFAVISFIDSKVKKLEIQEGAICVSRSISDFCLDITIKIKLFYMLLFLFDYFSLSIKKRKKSRRKIYVREQNG